MDRSGSHHRWQFDVGRSLIDYRFPPHDVPIPPPRLPLLPLSSPSSLQPRSVISPPHSPRSDPLSSLHLTRPNSQSHRRMRGYPRTQSRRYMGLGRKGR